MLTHGEIPEVDAASFHLLRPRLFGIACRVLDSAAEADDVVQDTWIRWQRTDRSQVRDPTGFLVTATTRLALTAGQSRVRAMRLPSDHGWSSRSPTEPIPRVTRSSGGHWNSRCGRSWRRCRPLKEPSTSCARRSTTRTGRSRSSSP
jgi:RNA polymerase sigma-70 factor (ECF subfamily)